MASNKVNLDVSEKLDITCRKGDSFELTINLKDSSGVGLPLVTDNYEFLMQVKGFKTTQGRPLVLSTLGKGEQRSESGSFIEFVNKDDSGNVTIKSTAESMREVTPGRYTYDLQYKTGTTVKTILKGRFVVNDDISEELS